MPKSLLVVGRSWMGGYSMLGQSAGRSELEDILIAMKDRYARNKFDEYLSLEQAIIIIEQVIKEMRRQS